MSFSSENLDGANTATMLDLFDQEYPEIGKIADRITNFNPLNQYTVADIDRVVAAEAKKAGFQPQTQKSQVQVATTTSRRTRRPTQRSLNRDQENNLNGLDDKNDADYSSGSRVPTQNNTRQNVENSTSKQANTRRQNQQRRTVNTQSRTKRGTKRPSESERASKRQKIAFNPVTVEIPIGQVQNNNAPSQPHDMVQVYPPVNQSQNALQNVAQMRRTNQCITANDNETGNRQSTSNPWSPAAPP